ncbi:hypothetical protein VKT23_020123 [Stygiomarasmius scandens]|uniref:Uncharacterized protein n=1 Tax=Marasmiellus scandens TaxID=2682957 RepID=A0ABR1IJQ5_9AGAR
MSQWPDSVTVVLDDWDFPETSAWQHLEGLNPNYTQSVYYKRSVMKFNQTLDKEKGTAWIVNASAGDMAFFGWAPSATFQAIIPDGETQEMQYSSTNTIGKIFETNSSMDGFALEFFEETRIDYVLCMVPESETDLQETSILVDDSSSEIAWDGLWDPRPHYLLSPSFESWDDLDLEEGPSTSLPGMEPHGGGTHASTTQGDSFSFQFAGSSIMVAGINPFQDSPPPPPHTQLNMLFTVDNNSLEHQFMPGSSNPYDDDENRSSRAGYPHYVYYQSGPLEPGNHILTVNVTHITNGGMGISAIIDYLVYKPIFSTLSEKPDFSQTASSSVTPSPMSPEPTGAGTTPPSFDSSPGANKKVISGAVVGSVVGLALVVFGLWWFCRRRKIQRRYHLETPITESKLSLAKPEPFVLTVPVNDNLDQKSKRRLPTRDNSQTEEWREEWGEECHGSKSTRVLSLVSSEHQQIPTPLASSSFIPTESRALDTPDTNSLNGNQESRPGSTQNTLTETPSMQGVSRNSTIDTQALESQMREIHSRVEMLSTEMSRYMIPPAYDNGINREHR